MPKDILDLLNEIDPFGRYLATKIDELDDRLCFENCSELEKQHLKEQKQLLLEVRDNYYKITYPDKN